MNIFKNAIDEQFSRYCLDYIKKIENCPVWTSSTLHWPEGIKNGITGSCVTTIAEDDLKNEVLTRISKYLPENANGITVMLCIWQQYSGLSTHTDSGYNFASTIYLNDSWNIDWGGIFLYYDKDVDWNSFCTYESIMKDSENWKVIIPECGTMVLNTDEKMHLVTPMSPLSPNFRYTIQIWGHT
jgi:hypothetical protein